MWAIPSRGKPPMQIVIPDAFKLWIDEQVARHGFPNADAFVANLLQREQAKDPPDEACADGAPPHLTVGTRAELEAKLLEALDSGPATPLTAEDWQEIRRQVRERGAQRKPP